MLMRLKRDASDEDLTAAASLEAWSTREALATLTTAQQVHFLRALSSAVAAIADKLEEKPKRTRKPRKKADAPEE